MRQKNSFGLNIGSSSILVIFILLCLITFATLSLVSANADYKLSKRIAARTDSYYAANNKAQEMLRVMDEAMQTALSDATDLDAYHQKLTDSLSKIKYVTVGYDTHTVSIDYRTPISDSQTLHVTLQALYPASTKRYEITAWQVENTDTWDADDSIQLIDPDDFQTMED